MLPCLGVLLFEERLEPWANILVSPTLYRVTLVTSDSFEERDALGAFLQGLIAAAPKLRELNLTMGAFSQLHIRMVAQFKSLQSILLNVCPPDVDTLREIFTLQNITDLTLNFGDKEFRGPQAGNMGLESLRNLQIHAQNFASIGDCIDFVSCNDLEVLCITHTRPITMDDTSAFLSELWRGLLNRLSRWSHSLQNLNLSVTSQRTIQPSLILLDELLPLKNLQFLSLSLNLQLLDGDIRRMATSWPNLRTLHFPDENSPICFSMTTLETIALHWPSIEVLMIPSLDLYHLSQPRHVRSHRLAVCRVRSVSFKDPVLVAQNLDSLFPSLMTLYGLRPEDVKRWEKVERIRRAFHRVKKAHEKRLQSLTLSQA